MQEIQKRVRPNTTIIKFDSCVMELATNRNRNGGYWPKCDSPLSNPNIHIGNFWDMQLDNQAMIYFCRQWSNDECLVIHWFCSSHYCSCIITNYVLTCEMKLVGSILIFFRFFSDQFQSLAPTTFTDGAPYLILYDGIPRRLSCLVS